MQRVLARAHVQTTGRTAAAFAEAGVRVFPCVPGGKTPLTGHGFLDATTDLTRVNAWWGHWPTANIGVATGMVSGVLVVDVDVRATGSGFDAFQRASDHVDTSGWACRVRTPSGGLHVWYPADPVVPRSSWVCARAHVDFRGEGGYVVVPPSVVEVPGVGRVPYQVVEFQSNPHPIDSARLRDVLDPDRVRQRLTNRCGRTTDAPVDTSRLVAWVAGRPEGERNTGLFWAACRMAETGSDMTSALAALTPAAASAGLLDHEIRTTVTSAYRHTHARVPVAPASSPRLAAPRPVAQYGVVVL